MLIFYFLIPILTYANTLKIASDPWCPFTCQPGEKNEGILIDSLKEALGDEYKIEYHEVSWARAVEDARKGNYNAIAGALKEDAPGFLFPTVSIVDQKSCFYTANENRWIYSGLKSLHDKRLGVVKNYKYGTPLDDEILKKNNQILLETVSGEETLSKLVKMLQANRVDAFIEDKTVVEYYEKQNKIKLRAAGCLAGSKLFVAFSPNNKNNKKAVALYSKKITEMLKVGRIQQIIDKYK